MTELVVTRGIPASGKTTWARAWVAEDDANRARVNRDDLRQTLYGRDAPLPHELESALSAAQQAAVEALLRSGRSVVVDDMHLRASYLSAWRGLALSVGADFRVELIDTPLELCIERATERYDAGGRAVAIDFIRSAHARLRNSLRSEPTLKPEPDGSLPYLYERTGGLPSAWLVDIDGTLALMGDRSPFDYSRIGEDTLHYPVRHLLHALRIANWQIVVMSGRPESCRAETELWLARHDIEHEALLMRATGDQRKDAVVKLELFRTEVAPRFAVMGVLDDRNQVVDMWRSIGLFCAQVAPGAF